MLERFQPVAWMIDTPESWTSRQELLARQHRAELRLAHAGPSAFDRLVERVRRLATPAPVAPECATCTA